MRANAKMAKHQFDQNNPDADRFAFFRHVTVAFDSMYTKGRFKVNHQTHELVGVADNAFDIDVITAELKQLGNQHR